jgi:hypothetical protein
MIHPFTFTDLRAVLRFPFQSRADANRLLAGAALSLGGIFVPILPTLLVHGYVVRVLRRAVRGEALALPEWDDWGQLAGDGVRGTLIALLYLAPGIVVTVTGYLVYFVLWFGSLNTLENMPARGASPALFFSLVFGALAVLFLSLFLGWTLSFLGLLPLPVALAHFAAEDRFAAAFDVPAWWRTINADRWGYLLGWVITLGLAGVIYVIFMAVYFTIVLCFLASFILAPLGFYLLLVSAVVFGQFYRSALARLRGAVI